MLLQDFLINVDYIANADIITVLSITLLDFDSITINANQCNPLTLMQLKIIKILQHYINDKSVGILLDNIIKLENSINYRELTN